MRMTNEENKYNRVVAYIRKSSEDNKSGEANKQLNSIEYQRRFVKEAIEKYKLKLVKEPFEDSKTGYEAFVRDGENGFNKMLEYLEENKDEVDGIICTEISRLARNMADGGMILWYMQCGIIKRIYTPSKVFTNSSADQMMVAIEFVLSKKNSDDTGYRTKEGLKNKALSTGHPPTPAVLGYYSTGPRGKREWHVDKNTGPLVRMVFEQFATGEFTIEEISEIAYKLGLRSKKHKKDGDKLTKSSWYNRLKDIKYTGIFYLGGERIPGKYEPLIDSVLFYRVQNVLNDNKHPKGNHMGYAYTGMIRCGLCGGLLSATHKKGITYYRCNKKKLPCKDIDPWPYVPESNLEDVLIKALEEIEINDEAWREARTYVSEVSQPQKVEIQKRIRQLNEQVIAEERFQLEVGRKYTSGEMAKSEHDRLVEDSVQKATSFRNTIIKCENIAVEIDQLMKDFLDSIKFVSKRLRTARAENKRELVDIFCENLEWKGKKLTWDWKKAYFVFANQPKKSQMLPLVDSLRRFTPLGRLPFTS